MQEEKEVRMQFENYAHRVNILNVVDASDARYLLDGDHAVVQPVRNVLRRDAQRGAILHEANVVHIRHLRAPDALVHPAHHVAENALAVVVQLLLALERRPRRRAGDDRQREDGAEVGGRARGNLGLREPNTRFETNKRNLQVSSQWQ